MIVSETSSSRKQNSNTHQGQTRCSIARRKRVRSVSCSPRCLQKKRACRGVPEVTDGKAAGACGCGEVVSQVGGEGGEEWLMELNLSGHYVYGYLRLWFGVLTFMYTRNVDIHQNQYSNQILNHCLYSCFRLYF